MNTIGSKIKKIRENSGIKQEFMALELEISQSNYGRLEKDDSRLNIPKLKKITKILNIPIYSLFDEKHTNHQDENYKKNDPTNINNEKEHIKSLKDEIVFLRNLVENKIR